MAIPFPVSGELTSSQGKGYDYWVNPSGRQHYVTKVTHDTDM